MTTGAESVAVLGVGRMGLPISRRLREAGHHVTVFDVEPDRRRAAERAGCVGAATAADAVSSAQLTLTLLPGSAELAVLMSPGGAVMSALPPSSTWIDLTSTSPAVARALATAAAERGVATLDAPMGGGPDAAATGELTLYVGGDVAVLERWTPTLAAVASTVHHLGASGTGCLVKHLVNLLWFGQAALSAEAALLAASAGVPADRLREVLLRGPAASRFLERDFPRVFDGDYLPTFGLDRVVEELDTVAAEAADRAVPSRVMDAVAGVHREALRQLGPIDGELAVVAHLEALAHRKL